MTVSQAVWLRTSPVAAFGSCYGSRNGLTYRHQGKPTVELKGAGCPASLDHYKWELMVIG